MEASNLKESQKSNKSEGKNGRSQRDDQKRSGMTETSNNKQESVSMSKIIKIIETCESRVTLDWVPGQEGLSNEFQELKK